MGTIAIAAALLLLFVALRLSDRFVRKSRAPEGDLPDARGGGVVRFPLAGRNVFVDGTLKLMVALSWIGCLVVLGLYASGVLPWDIALIAAAVLIATPAGYWWQIHDVREGAVELHDTHLVVQTRRSRQVYAWQHIAGIQVTTLKLSGAYGRWLTGLAGLDERERLLQVRLRRMARASLSGSEYGSDIAGIPVPFTKTAYLQVADPDEVVEQARRFLSARAAP